MSLQCPSRAVIRTAGVLTPQATLGFLQPWSQQRAISFLNMFGRKKRVEEPGPQNPLTEEYLQRKRKGPTITRGDLASSSVFEDETLAGPKPTASATQGRKPLASRNPERMAAALDPNPAARLRWERKMVIRDITKRGRLSTAQKLKREERELTAKSHQFKTSLKKLRPLATQITGKSVEDAITQMRFSKKKAAKDVKLHLENAKNEAIVRRGMGLGPAIKGQEFTPIDIKTKDGKRLTVTDPSKIYVDQAWVGKGQFMPPGTDFRAMGRAFKLDHPTTTITLVLKEEATRMRQHRDREEKLKNRKVWVHLPNRPIVGQRQHYSW